MTQQEPDVVTPLPVVLQMPLKTALTNIIRERKFILSMRKDYPTVRKCFLWRRPVKRMAV